MNNDMTELSRVSLEEIFLDDPEARAEFERECDISREEAIAAQEAHYSNLMNDKEEFKFPNDNEIELVINSKFYKLMSLIAEKEDLNNSHQDWSDVRFPQMYQQGFKNGLEYALRLMTE